MSFVTFILLTSFYLAQTTGFDPEQIGYIYTKTIFIWIFETTIQKGLFYFMNIANPPFFELLSYTGYKFVVVCLVVISQYLLGDMMSYGSMFVLGLLYCLFFF